MTTYAELMRRPVRLVAVQNYLSSGTLFLHSLFDGHPDVMQFPGLAMRKYFDFWAEMSRANPNGNAPVIGMFASAFKLLFNNAASEWKEWGVTDCAVDLDTFHRHLHELLSATNGPITRKAFLVCIHMAYYLTRGLRIPERPLILFPIHGKRAHIAADMLEDWPDARFVYMVRHPVSAFVSMVQHIRKAGKYRGDAVTAALSQLFLNRTLHGVSYECFGDRPYPSAKPEQCKAFQLEQLHRSPEMTLREICHWIGVPFSQRLFYPTFGGKIWNNRAGSVGAGFDPRHPWRDVADHTTWIDRAVLTAIAAPKLCAWGYDTPGPWGALLAFVPFKLERGGYWRNRLTLIRAFVASGRDANMMVTT